MLTEYKTRFLGRDLNFTIELSSNSNLGGLSESLDDFIADETGLSINPADDGEKLKYIVTSAITYTFNFFNNTGMTYGPSLINAGFTQLELTSLTASLKKSFYLFQVYNSTDTNSQILLHSGYYNGFTFLSGTTSYSIDPSAEISGYYISNENLANIDNDQLYLKLSFYNAKTGKLQLFQNQAKLSGTTEDMFYFNGTLDSTNLMFILPSPVVAREFVNTAYLNKLNENVPTFSYEAPVYPTGGTSLSGNTYFNT